MNAIKDYFLYLAGEVQENGIIINLNGIRIDLKEKGLYLLSVMDKNIIELVIIPFFDGLT